MGIQCHPRTDRIRHSPTHNAFFGPDTRHTNKDETLLGRYLFDTILQKNDVITNAPWLSGILPIGHSRTPVALWAKIRISKVNTIESGESEREQIRHCP
jgi:hypothetical protein